MENTSNKEDSQCPICKDYYGLNAIEKHVQDVHGVLGMLDANVEKDDSDEEEEENSVLDQDDSEVVLSNLAEEQDKNDENDLVDLDENTNGNDLVTFYGITGRICHDPLLKDVFYVVN